MRPRGFHAAVRGLHAAVRLGTEHPYHVLVTSDSPRMTNADLLRSFLAEVDVPCPVCGYSLRSLPEPRCPECGTELRLYIHPHVPFSWGFLVGVFGGVIGFVFALGVVGLALAVTNIGMAFIAGSLGFLSLVQMILWERRYHRWHARHHSIWTFITCATWLPAAILIAMGAWMLL